MNDFLDQAIDRVDEDGDELLEAVTSVGLAVQVLHEISGEDAEASSIFTVDGQEMEITVSVRVLS